MSTLTVIDHGGAQRVTVTGRPEVSFLGLGVAGPTGPPGSGGVWVYDGAAYVLAPTARVFIQRTGDPAPTGLTTNDLVYQET